MRISTLPEEDQVALGRELAALSVSIGPTWLMDAPILLPRPQDFPDQWRPDLDGAEVMLERLPTYAGLGEFPFSIEPFDGEEALLDHLTSWHRSGAVAFFPGRDDRHRRQPARSGSSRREPPAMVWETWFATNPPLKNGLRHFRSALVLPS
jgi:hypothetical protein